MAMRKEQPCNLGKVMTITLMPKYRLKMYHRGYNKGNVIHFEPNYGTYGNVYLSQFKRLCRASFTIGYIEQHPEIFEKL